MQHLKGTLIYLQGNIEGNNKTDEPIIYTKVIIEQAVYDMNTNAFNFDFSGNDIYGTGYVKGWLYSDFKFLGKAHYSEDFPEEPLEGRYYSNDNGFIIIGRWLSQGVYTHFISELKKDGDNI